MTKCHLHSSVVLSKLNRHDEALRCLGQVLLNDYRLHYPDTNKMLRVCTYSLYIEQQMFLSCCCARRLGPSL